MVTDCSVRGCVLRALWDLISQFSQWLDEVSTFIPTLQIRKQIVRSSVSTS